MKIRSSKLITQREREVLKLWGTYMNVVRIAEELQVSVHTVQTHLKRTRKKMGVSKTIWAWRQLYMPEQVSEGNPEQAKQTTETTQLKNHKQ